MTYSFLLCWARKLAYFLEFSIFKKEIDFSMKKSFITSGPGHCIYLSVFFLQLIELFEINANILKRSRVLSFGAMYFSVKNFSSTTDGS